MRPGRIEVRICWNALWRTSAGIPVDGSICGVKPLRGCRARRGRTLNAQKVFWLTHQL